MNIALFIALAASSPVERGGHWLTDSFTLEVVAAPDVVGTEELMRAAEAAAETWNQTGEGPQIIVVPAEKIVRGGFHLDGHNTLKIVTAGWDADPRMAGLTMRALRGDVITEIDSKINAADWDFVDGGETGKLDLQSVLTHELGHTLGLLDDFDHDEATMFWGSHEGDVSKRDLSSEDLAALEHAYDGVVLSSTDGHAAGCAQAGDAAAPLGALALVVLAAAKRRATGGTL
jgi:hypothetical protein